MRHLLKTFIQLTDTLQSLPNFGNNNTVLYLTFSVYDMKSFLWWQTQSFPYSEIQRKSINILQTLAYWTHSSIFGSINALARWSITFHMNSGRPKYSICELILNMSIYSWAQVVWLNIRHMSNMCRKAYIITQTWCTLQLSPADIYHINVYIQLIFITTH